MDRTSDGIQRDRIGGRVTRQTVCVHHASQGDVAIGVDVDGCSGWHVAHITQGTGHVAFAIVVVVDRYCAELHSAADRRRHIANIERTIDGDAGRTGERHVAGVDDVQVTCRACDIGVGVVRRGRYRNDGIGRGHHAVVSTRVQRQATCRCQTGGGHCNVGSRCKQGDIVHRVTGCGGVQLAGNGYVAGQRHDAGIGQAIGRIARHIAIGGDRELSNTLRIVTADGNCQRLHGQADVGAARIHQVGHRQGVVAIGVGHADGAALGHYGGREVAAGAVQVHQVQVQTNVAVGC